MENFERVMELVRQERERQVQKWGRQRHGSFTWMSILMEEVGEASQACLHDTFGGKAAGTFKTELIHVAAVAVQIVEEIIAGEESGT